MVLEKLMIITGYDKFYRTIQECSTFLEIEPVIFQWETASPELVRLGKAGGDYQPRSRSGHYRNQLS